MNETLKTISTRYSCRSYSDQMPEQEKLDAIAAAAIQAPSGMNIQPWKIIMVKNRQMMHAFEQEGIQLLKSMEDQSAYERVMGRGGLVYYNAPCMFLIVVDASSSAYTDVDIGIVTQNIALAASSQGLGSVICAMAGIPFSGAKGDQLKKQFQFPEGYEFGMAVLVGYAKETKQAHQPDPSKIIVLE